MNDLLNRIHNYDQFVKTTSYQDSGKHRLKLYNITDQKLTHFPFVKYLLIFINIRRYNYCIFENLTKNFLYLIFVYNV